MNSKTYLTVLLLTISVLISLSFITYDEPKNEGYFLVEIIQDGKTIKTKNNKIKLKKAPFKFKVTMSKTNHVFVSNSWGTYYYDYPSNENIFKCEDDLYFKDCRFVSIKTGNEDKFNVNKDIYVGDDSYQNVWFYKEDRDWHRFDEDVTVEDGIITAFMTVENIYDMDKRDERTFEKSEYNYPVNQIDKDIYVVFATDFYESGMEHPKELQREKFILEFK
jgi:hypothetical protein